jgi:hypothetical protein
MSIYIFVIIVIFIAIISWHKNRNKTSIDLITKQDKTTINICIQMALQIIGNATNISNSKSPAEAIEIGKNSIINNTSHVVVANSLLMGFLGAYAKKIN